jgi:hypothetical protein
MTKVSNFCAAILSFLVLATSHTSLAQNCGCGPDYCKADSRYPSKLATKKNAMKNAGYPSDLIALMDRDGACVARVEVDLQGAKTILGWAEDQEDVARKQLIDGRLKTYYKFNVRKRFACCGDPKAEDAEDWDPTDQLSTGIAIKCTKSGASVACK